MWKYTSKEQFQGERHPGKTALKMTNTYPDSPYGEWIDEGAPDLAYGFSFELAFGEGEWVDLDGGMGGGGGEGGNDFFPRWCCFDSIFDKWAWFGIILGARLRWWDELLEDEVDELLLEELVEEWIDSESASDFFEMDPALDVLGGFRTALLLP